MLILRRHAYARAGLVGNPSDGYHGKTIALTVPDFQADVVLYEWEDVEVVSTRLDKSRFRSIHDLIHDVQLHGYYGGIRLLKASIKKFVEYCQTHNHSLHENNFSLRYESTIPRQVGLGGSSAIIVAALRCLMDFYHVDIPREIQPSLALSVEKEELGIAAGLQDRVIQVYEGLLYMDFAQEHMEQTEKACGFACARYEPLNPENLPPMYLAYNPHVSEPTEVFHNDLRGRFARNEPLIVNAMKTFAEFAELAKAALTAGDHEKLASLINQNFDLRHKICKLPGNQVRLVQTARHVGASAKFAGSGGAIIGTFVDEAMFENLQQALGGIGCRVLRLIL